MRKIYEIRTGVVDKLDKINGKISQQTQRGKKKVAETMNKIV